MTNQGLEKENGVPEGAEAGEAGGGSDGGCEMEREGCGMQGWRMEGCAAEGGGRRAGTG